MQYSHEQHYLLQSLRRRLASTIELVDTLKAVDIELHVSSAFTVYVCAHIGAGNGVSVGCVPSAYAAGFV